MDEEQKPEGSDFEESQRENDSISAIGDDELSKIAVAKALGFEKVRDLTKYSDQVGRLVEYAHMKGANDITGIVSELNLLRNELGLGKDIYNLAVYAGLALEKARIDKEMHKWQLKS